MLNSNQVKKHANKKRGEEKWKTTVTVVLYAIYHGMEGVYDDGEITISVYEKDNLIHIDVSDNGLGMPEKVVEYIMHNRVVSSKRGSGIGVRNVDERIKLIYGEQYGVTIESELDEGTTATIIIPKLEETAEINSDESNKTKL